MGTGIPVKHAEELFWHCIDRASYAQKRII